MVRRGFGAVGAIILGLAVLAPARAASPDPVRELQNAFEEYCGAKLVFAAEDLPPGHYHDSMPALSRSTVPPGLPAIRRRKRADASCCCRSWLWRRSGSTASARRPTS